MWEIKLCIFQWNKRDFMDLCFNISDIPELDLRNYWWITGIFDISQMESVIKALKSYSLAKLHKYNTNGNIEIAEYIDIVQVDDM